MNIGIMTFHWAINHGALLQTYALQHTLTDLFADANVEIIDYWPEKYKKNVIRCFKSKNIKVIQRNLKDLKKQKKLIPFRNKIPTTHRYYSQQQLIQENMNYDVVIAGSDQIWNQSFTMNGEGCKTAAYYLPFCNSAVKLSYAASFGCMSLEDKTIEFITPLLKRFDAISVRENSGKEILSRIGIDATVVCDPSVLLPVSSYLQLSKHTENEVFIALYLLHLVDYNQKKEIIRAFPGQKIKDIEMNTEEEWIGSIADASFLVTNSYHGMMVALKMHTPFAVVLSSGVLTGMNDRFYTILERIGLMNRVITKENQLSSIYNSPIEWDSVDEELQRYAEESKQFLLNHCLIVKEKSDL